MKRQLKAFLRKIPLIDNIARRLSPHYDYRRTWVSAAGRKYREATYARQNSSGSLPLCTHPTAEELIAVLDKYKIRCVIDVGCGWGRMLEELEASDQISVADGCDVSKDWLGKCRPGLNVFHLDICDPAPEIMRDKQCSYEAAYTRGVFPYLMKDDELIRRGVNTIDRLAAHKVFFWEWPEVLVKIKKFAKGPKFEFFEIPHVWGA